MYFFTCSKLRNISEKIGENTIRRFIVQSHELINTNRIHFLPIARSRYCRFEMGEMAATCSANLASGETVAFEVSLERLRDEHVFLNDLE